MECFKWYRINLPKAIQKGIILILAEIRLVVNDVKRYRQRS